MDLSDKTVLILGGTSGIGEALVYKSVALNANVIFSGTNNEKGLAIMTQANIRRQQALFHACDITHWPSQVELYKVANAAFSRTIDIVIIVAGILESSSLTKDDELDGSYRTLEVNLTAAAKANRLAIQHFFRTKKAGCVINTSSIYGFCAAPLAPLYSASKHAIIGLTKSYGTLLRSTNIRVNAIAPHFVETPMIVGKSKQIANALGTVPMGRCLDAYFRAVFDPQLNGDIITVTSESTFVEPRYTDPIQEKLDSLCHDRKKTALDEIMQFFS
ncbi:uncharacterized protein BYT42DRAFT_574964 [Radiomyces spectabilis]|uniref:uncharacterized protein n=1 Tax=Radiomyces spectabilis TaxID=64574 RepID=UPI00222116C7|nr:uncharacterized protein BYT42DRAFT_574964 [Radiomyces spectabilis]KAI8376539.1 hypothetical protein BYT42DRAFT_574964 [Radiomyces spectabilis]